MIRSAGVHAGRGNAGRFSYESGPAQPDSDVSTPMGPSLLEKPGGLRWLLWRDLTAGFHTSVTTEDTI